LAALTVGDFRGAAAALEEVVSSAPDLALAHEMLGGLSLGALDDYPRALHHFEISYRLHRKVGNLPAAARAAISLAQVDETSGNGAGARGWLSRSKRLIDEIGPCLVVVDVRPVEEYRAAHLPGAVSIPLQELDQRLRELPRQCEIVAYCCGPYCALASEAVRTLRAHAYAARHLIDGLPEWAAAGNRIESVGA
jgi:rhodanese-related sulfurtransferase